MDAGGLGFANRGVGSWTTCCAPPENYSLSVLEELYSLEYSIQLALAVHFCEEVL